MPTEELFLGALIMVLFERLASQEVLNFARRAGIRSQLENWSDMLLRIQAGLADAEHKQTRDSSVNLWLQSLRDLAYDVDDLLDEFAYDALAKNNTSSARGESSKVYRLVRPLAAYNPYAVVSNARMESKIKVITARFRDTVTRQAMFNLSETTETTSGLGWNLDDRRTRFVVEESVILGREEDKETIIQLLLKGSDQAGVGVLQAGVGVLPIIGMGGVGKTSLAQLVYNDRTVKDYFPVRAWTYMSDQFDVKRITKSILESLKLTPSGTDLDSLQKQLRRALFSEKFLIILDNVWNEDFGAWHLLCAPFWSGMFGSMVIVTTRNQEVAHMVCDNFSPYSLWQLSDDICCSIFLRHALGVTISREHENLANIGVKIVRRCEGLPLAAKMLGGILRNHHRSEQWKDILHSEIWDSREGGILSTVKLSYHHLPSPLKQCFAYCSLFPVNYEFEKEDLILLWMAEGFLPCQKKQMEELGSYYFDHLTSRSFFQPSATSSSTFVMHDLIHDMARHVASDAYLHVDNYNATSQNTATTTVRHFSFVRGDYDAFKRLEAFSDMNSLRTFLALPIQKRPHLSSLSQKVLLDLLLKLTGLRVLSLCGYQIEKLPDSLGQLKHLRYLNMAGAKIESLPDSVTILFNLLTLILRECTNLKELPSSIGNLVNLLYLDLDDTPKLLQMPSGMRNLKGLQKLSKFIVGELGISDLNKFSSLGRNLWIACLHNVVDISSAIHASLNTRDELEKLRMEWTDEFNYREEEIERQVLHHLQPPKSVQNLDIVYYGGKRLPFWIGDPLCAPNMVRLRIGGCKNVTLLPPLGRLPLLKQLTLRGLDRVTRVGDELYGYDDPLFLDKAFPSLETLFISDMEGWEEWSCSGRREGLHNLHALALFDCPKLMGKLPSHLPSLKDLRIENCPRLTTTPSPTWSIVSLNDVHLDKCVIGEGSLQVHLSTLTKLRISNISDLCCLNILNTLPGLRELIIYQCPRLSGAGGKLSITGFHNVVDISGATQASKYGVEELRMEWRDQFDDSRDVEFERKVLHHLQPTKSVQKLEIVYYGGKELPFWTGDPLCAPNMARLRIDGCKNLTSLPSLGRLPLLKELTMCGLDKVTSMGDELYGYDYHHSVGKAFPSLETLSISDMLGWEEWCCSSGGGADDLGRWGLYGLRTLTVTNCPKLKGKLPSHLPSLIEVQIKDCPQLTSSPLFG